ncbi:MAG TPA: uroporphyrinogen-III synthase, partial [Microthrixaceae bacterium]|nr:uroporphyrinogen-III synthase [Microthrixaceae bacterium]
MSEPLVGFTVAITGHRRSQEQYELLTQHGATVLRGQMVDTSPLHDVAATISATNDLVAGGADIVVLTTGIGTRSWFSAAESAGLGTALRELCSRSGVMVRGSKAHSAAIGCGLNVDWSARGETSGELVEHLTGLALAGKRVAVQREGGEPHLARRLRTLGAQVIDVPTYRCALSEGTSASRGLIEAVLDDRVDAITFTSRAAVAGIFSLAPNATALGAALDRRCMAVSIGPVTTAALRELGVRRVIEPQRA